MPARNVSVLLDQIHDGLKYHARSGRSIAGLNWAILHMRLDTINRNTDRAA
jgi:hypothetical protein